jgi:hypothetical protein
MSVQQGRSGRRPEAYPLGYVEDLSDARTPLADFFSILLELLRVRCHADIEMCTTNSLYKQCVRRNRQEDSTIDGRKWRERPR